MYPNSVFGVQSALASVTVAVQGLQTTCAELRRRIDGITTSSLTSETETDLQKKVQSLMMNQEKFDNVINSIQSQIASNDNSKTDLRSFIAEQVVVEVRRQKDLLETSLSHRYDSVIPGIVLRQLDNAHDSKDSKVTQLDSKVTRLDSKVTRLDSDVTRLDSDVTRLDSTVTRLDTRLDSNGLPSEIHGLDISTTVDLPIQAKRGRKVSAKITPNIGGGISLDLSSATPEFVQE